MFTVSVEQQFFVFCYLVAAGVLMGLFFDFLKAAGRVLNFSGISIFFLDIFVCLAAALIVFQGLFLTNRGEVRFYVFLALFTGVVVYYFLFSPKVYPLFLKLFKFFKKVIIKILKFKRLWQDYFRKKRINNTAEHLLENNQEVKGLPKEDRHGR